MNRRERAVRNAYQRLSQPPQTETANEAQALYGIMLWAPDGLLL